MRRIALLAAVVALAACNNDSTSPNGSVTGSYSLHTVNGNPLPFTFSDGSVLVSDQLMLNANGTYVGQAAHCSGTGGATDTNGCTSSSLPIGTAVSVGGATRPGTLVYNSWLTMQGRGENNPDVCAYNDLALVKLDPAVAAGTSDSLISEASIRAMYQHWRAEMGL